MDAKGSTSPSDPPRPLIVAAILAAASLMLAVTGYSFGGGNHEVYLLEPLRRAGLASFAGDWFVNDTLQYHGLFAAVAALLFRLDVARGGFLVAFFCLLLATAWAWWRLVRALGGGVTAYLVAVVGYHLLLGDRGLGMYSLLQDGQFNAGNVAAVSLLVGIVLWVEGRVIWSGVALGVAGAFHLNYAVVAPLVWLALIALRRPALDEIGLKPNPESAKGRLLTRDRNPTLRRLRVRLRRVGASVLDGRVLVATTLALLPSLANVALALPSKLRETGTMPLDRFINLYVRLRHPHHYDPTAWPWWVWAAFALPIPLAAAAFIRSRRIPTSHGTACRGSGSGNLSRTADPDLRHAVPWLIEVTAAWQRAAHVWLLLMALQAFALLTAGLLWLGPTFVQLSLWRFSPHAKLLAVSAAAAWITSWKEWPSLQKGALFLICFPLPFAVFAAFTIETENGEPNPFAITFFLLLITFGLIQGYRQMMWVGRVVRTPVLWWLIVTPVAALGLLAASVPPLMLASGVTFTPGQAPPDAAVLAAADWAEANSPRDALFLLPPDASAFSVNARRGQVVSFKLVPQLAGELSEWDRRLRDVLDAADLSVYAGGFAGYRTAQRLMRDRYDALPTPHLFAVARRYGARYVFRGKADPADPTPVAWRGTNGAVLYDLQRPE